MKDSYEEESEEKIDEGMIKEWKVLQELNSSPYSLYPVTKLF